MGYLDDYRAKLNLTANLTPENLILNEMKRQFKEYLRSTPTKRIMKKYEENIEYLVDIQDVSQINKNNNDEKYCITEFDLQMQIGQLLNINEFENKNWIITEKENMTLEDRQRYKIRPCNNTLTFKNKLNKTVMIPCITSNLTLYSDGLEVKQITSLDGKRSIIIPLTDDTKDLYVQQRFIFNHNSVFSISLIDDFSVNGLLQLTMIQDTFKDTDDKINNLADNGEIPITITFSQTSYTINQGNVLQLQPIIKQGDKILNLSVNYTVQSVDNQGFVNVSNDGIVTGVSVGEGKVVCSLVGNSDVKGMVDIEVTSNVVLPSEMYTYAIEGNDILKKTSTNLYSGKVYYGGAEVPNQQYDFMIANYTGVGPSLITMSIVDGYSVKIKSNSNVGSILLYATLKNDNTKMASKLIQLKDIYGK